MRGRRKIGVLTSGGDAPGMNAAIRAVVRVGVESGLEIFGVRRGFNGLLTSDIICMNLRSVSDIIDLGGTDSSIQHAVRSLQQKKALL